jgi:transcriptional regulator with XRE-family HTH domain
VEKKDVGDRLREFRERLGMTQGALAAQVGVNVMTVTLWENKKNRRKMSNKYVYKAAEALKIRVSDLLGADDEPQQARIGEMPMTMTHTVDEVQWLRMYRLLPERLRLVQFAQLAECVARSNANQTGSHDTSIDSATRQSTIVSMIG